jgi:hypothetical protein
MPGHALARCCPCANVVWASCAEVYSWFTEGFDTADVQEAKALLEELA